MYCVNRTVLWCQVWSWDVYVAKFQQEIHALQVALFAEREQKDRKQQEFTASKSADDVIELLIKNVAIAV